MEQAELDTLIGELETRVDRLRALYDQYFMGIEKLEPQVPRKDIDRRIHVMRKEQIRNTGLRYRFQMILQRYNTYQTYWARIMRQIESGTYKRHVLRAEARFGDVLGRTGRRVSSLPPSEEQQHATHDIDDPFADYEPAPAGGRPVGGSLDGEFGLLEDPFERPPSSMNMPAVRPSEVPPPAQAPSPPASQPNVAGARPVWRKAAPLAPRVAPAPAPAPTPPRAPPLPPAASQPKVEARPAVAPGPRTSEPTLRTAPMVVPRAPTAPTETGPKPPVPRPAPAPPPPHPRAAAAGELPDERVRQLYAQYVDEKRKRNESTAAITFDGLAKSLRDSSAKLREKHGRPVDFEVVEKDGKTVIKPVVK